MLVRMLNMSKTQETSGNVSHSVSRTIEDPILIGRVGVFKTKSPVDQWPICATHGERVSIHEEGAAQPWGVPGFTVRFVACCEPALQRFFAFIDANLPHS